MGSNRRMTRPWSLGRRLAALAAAAALGGCVTVSDAPLRPVQASLPGKVFVVWYTGVGGWSDTDRRVIRALSDRGAPVVEVNSRQYFWKRRTPEEAAAALEDIVRRYEAKWPGRELVVAGYSFGGAAVPMILPHAGPETRARLRLVVLLAPSPKGQLVMRPWTLVDIFDPGDPSTEQTVAALTAPVLCLYGVEDRLAACPRLAGAAKIVLPGGHLLKGQDRTIAEDIFRAVDTAPSP